MPIVEKPPTAQRDLAAPTGQAPTGAKQRILETADRLFYLEGIHSVGVDKLISASSVTKATFYKHYGSKDRLILEYLRAQHLEVERLLDSIVAAAAGPEEAVLALIDEISAETHAAAFRGCAFINAAAEFADPRHPVREIVSSHRDWYTARLTGLLRQAGHPLPGDAADELILARDGAMTGAYAGDPVSATAALQRVVARILGETAS